MLATRLLPTAWGTWISMSLASWLILLVALPAGALRIDGERPGDLPAGIELTAGEGGETALRFATVGLTLPTEGNLHAGAGTVRLRLRMPGDWPAADDRALFHLGDKPHEHVTLLLRDGYLLAVYKGGEPYFAAIRSDLPKRWAPGSWHDILFTWQADGDDVDFLLVLDGELAGTAGGRILPVWPATCTVGSRGAGSVWQGLISQVELLPELSLPLALAPGSRVITVSADQPVGEAYPFWTVGNFNQPHRFVEPNFFAGTRAGRPYCSAANAVYLLGGRYRDQNNWYLGLSPEGRVQADFTGMVAQLRAALEAGFTPWIVLDNVPYTMSDPPQEHTYGNTAPAAEVRVWAEYVGLAVRAMVEAFGRETVASWWFRVGTEPDLNPGHWCGTKEEYLTHYDHTVAAVTAVLPEAIIGPGNILNPAGGQFGERSVGNWGLDIIDHCGQTGARMDWFSFSWYGRVSQPLTVFEDAVRAVRERLARYPRLVDTPLLVGEFAVLHDERGRRLWGGDSTEWAASFYAAFADRVYREGIREVYEWSQTTGGVPHARAHVLGMLAGMAGGQRLAVEVAAESAADGGAMAVRRGDQIDVILYNHRPLRQPKVPEQVQLVIGPVTGGWRLDEWLVDAEHGVWTHAFEADCRAAGLEPDPTAGRYEGSIERGWGKPGLALWGANRARYSELAQLPQVVTGELVQAAGGRLVIERDLAGHSVRHLRLRAVE